MPLTGGVIGIAIHHGLENYDNSPKLFGISVKSFKAS
jgi:hypothetical protein